MATHGALKARRVAHNAAGAVGVELLAAAQAIDFHRPLKTAPTLMKAMETIRANVPFYETDRFIGRDLEWAKAAVLDGGLSRAIDKKLFEAP
jgi:histidine ammonia-lyase